MSAKHTWRSHASARGGELHIDAEPLAVMLAAGVDGIETKAD